MFVIILLLLCNFTTGTAFAKENRQDSTSVEELFGNFATNTNSDSLRTPLPDRIVGKWHGNFRDEILWSLVRLLNLFQRIQVFEFEQAVRESGQMESVRFVKEHLYFDVELIIDRYGESIFRIDDFFNKYAIFAKVDSNLHFEGDLYQIDVDGSLKAVQEGLRRWRGSLELTKNGELRINFGQALRLTQERMLLVDNFPLRDIAMRMYRMVQIAYPDLRSPRDIGFMIEINFVGTRMYCKKMYGPEFWLYHSEGLEVPEPRLAEEGLGLRPYNPEGEGDQGIASTEPLQILRDAFTILDQEGIDDREKMAAELFSSIDEAEELYPFALLGQGMIEERQKNFAKAHHLYATFSQLKQNSVDGFWRSATLYRAQGYNEEERAMYDSINIRRKDDPYAYFRKAESWANSGFVTQAMEDANRAIKINDTTAMIYYFRGTLFTDAGKHKKALADYKKAYSLDSTMKSAGLSAAYSYFALEEYQNAEKLYGQFLSKNDTNSGAWYVRAVCNEQLNRPDSAYVYYRRAALLNPRNTNAHLGIIETLLALKRFREALLYYDKIALEYPEIVPQLASKIRQLRSSAQLETVLEEFQKELASDSSNINLLNDVGILQFLTSRYAAAVTTLLHSAGISPLGATEAYYLAASIYMIGDSAKAEEQFTKTFAAFGTTPTLEYLLSAINKTPKDEKFIRSLLKILNKEEELE